MTNLGAYFIVQHRYLVIVLLRSIPIYGVQSDLIPFHIGLIGLIVTSLLRYRLLHSVTHLPLPRLIIRYSSRASVGPAYLLRTYFPIVSNSRAFKIGELEAIGQQLQTNKTKVVVARCVLRSIHQVHTVHTNLESCSRKVVDDQATSASLHQFQPTNLNAIDAFAADIIPFILT